MALVVQPVSILSRLAGLELPGEDIRGLGASCGFTGPVFYVLRFSDKLVENSVGLAYKARSCYMPFHEKS